ncbi:MAG: hypothetical protein MUF38_17485 [Anaerolineae bacterium]|nr:hypothetical protein [Anaerolineae bacterium]
MRRSELLNQITQVFPKQPYPKAQAITLKDDVRGTEEYDTAQAFRGKSWQDLDTETVRYYSVALHFFTPQAYRYFLPAYMTLCVTHYTHVDMAVDTLIGTLRSPSVGDVHVEGRSRFQEVVTGLTDAQKGVIAHFLAYMGETHHKSDAISALTRYWQLFQN